MLQGGARAAGPAALTRAPGIRRGVILAFAAASALIAAPALSFDSKGHLVLEALAYRTLIEGHDGKSPRPDVLQDLFNDGALDSPICFGRGASPPGYCSGTLMLNPLLDWPRPQTDQPDAAFRRQFSDPGQCFHFMATLEDAKSENIPGTRIPRGLATSAVVRCRDLLRTLVRQVVINGGPGTRRSAYGLYELMHTVGDSFSDAHSARLPGGREIEYLRVWKPLEKIAHIPLERSARIPQTAFHRWNDQRDKDYVRDRVVVAGGDAVGDRNRSCRDLTDHPYKVPFECLSERGDQARQALVELLVVVRDLRRAHLAARAAAETPDSAPERSGPWRVFEDKWFAPAYECRDEECGVRQPPDLLPGAYGLLGLGGVYNASRRFFDATARGSLLRYVSELNPFVYVVQADIGYRRFHSGEDSGLAGLSLDLILPIGKRASIGFTPGEWRIAFGGAATAPDLATRFFRFDTRVGERLFLTLTGPMEVNWRKPAVEWSFGLGLTYAPGRSQATGGPLLQRHSEMADRHEDAWSPPPAPFGRLMGRRPTFYVGVGASTVETPEGASPGRAYGLGTLGGSVMWDRDRWGGRHDWTPSVSLALGSRRTSGESAYLTGVFGVGLRWYPLRVLGLSVTPVRIEGGPKIRGRDEDDPSADVHGSVGAQHYLQAGSRLGVAFNAGLVDLLVEAPTIAWRSKPFDAGEVLSVSLAIRLN